VSSIRVFRALVSVSDKTGLLELAHGLVRHGVKIVSTGGTATTLRDAGFTVRDVAELTGFPELFDGRVKTLHPAVHGGILYRRGHAADEEGRHRHGIVSIDLVIVNLYPFEATVARAGVEDAEAIDQIDIGGPALIRAAAKNHRHVVVVVEPAQYAPLLDALDRNGGAVPAALAREFARRGFERTAAYDAAIAGYLDAVGEPAAGAELRTASGVPGFTAVAAPGPGAAAAAGTGGALPERWANAYRKRQALRYGENPGQEGALYAPEAGVRSRPWRRCGEDALVQQSTRRRGGRLAPPRIRESRGGRRETPESLGAALAERRPTRSRPPVTAIPSRPSAASSA